MPTPHAFAEGLNDVATEKRGAAATVRRVLDAWLTGSSVQQREYFQLRWTLRTVDDHEEPAVDMLCGGAKPVEALSCLQQGALT